MAVNKINYCLCHEATMFSILPASLPTCNFLKVPNFNVSITTKSAGSQVY